MITEKELLTLAMGAAASATGYITECLDIDAEKPLTDIQHQALFLTLSLTLVLLETTLKGIIRNPETRERIRATVEALAKKISEEAGLTKPDGPAKIIRVDPAS